MIYPDFIQKKEYSSDLQDRIEKAVDLLLQQPTNITNPGMLLGKIQSGKTRTFIGIIALGFDKGFDNCIVFTKGTKALTEQTYRRLDSEFRDYIDNDIMRVYDIMNIQEQLTPWIRKRKLIIVVKKQTKNLDRLVDLFNNYPDLLQRKTLIIDDEADFASVGFKKDKTKDDGVDMNILASKINGIREGFNQNYSFLQVTATPYSLYLQRKGEIELNSAIIQPIKPAFTVVVPVHEQYIGGKQYFEDSEDPESIYSHLFVQVPPNEIDILSRRDQRYLTNILSSPNTRVFRQSIINYLVGGSIRIIQSQEQNKIYKSSFIMHIATGKGEHQWQIDLTEELKTRLTAIARANDGHFVDLLKESFNNYIPSIEKNQDIIPNFSKVLAKVKQALIDGEIAIIKTNSEEQTAALLDRNGQLRVDNPFNIFVGGYILDRGLTIDNLIGFFYGRNPQRFQQDTVLQHSRMYGARSMKDVAVTRFYTSNRIYRAMHKMYQFDAALTEAFEKEIQGGGDGSVVFIERDKEGNIRPCAPNKILITSTETIRPFARFLPVGFQTKTKGHIKNSVDQVDSLLKIESHNFNSPFLISINTAFKIIDLINSTFEYDEKIGNLDYQWDIKTFKALIKRLSMEVTNISGKNLFCYVQTNRDAARMKYQNTAFNNAPDTGSGETAYSIARNVASDRACLVLLKQKGSVDEDKGWKGAEFWWPILVTPANSPIAIFATETI